MRFSKGSASGQAAIEFVLLGIVIVIALICITMVELGSDSPVSGTEKGSVEFKQTRAGTIEGKHIDSAGFSKSYYVTVRNGSHHADHEVSLAEYNAAVVGADFPVVLTDSDSVKTDEAQEQADNTEVDSAKSQAAERQNNAYWQWFWTHRLLTDMSAAGE